MEIRGCNVDPVYLPRIKFVSLSAAYSTAKKRYTEQRVTFCKKRKKKEKNANILDFWNDITLRYNIK